MRIDFLGEQADVVAEAKETLEELTRPLTLACARETLDEPEGTDRKGRLVSRETVDAVRDIPVDEAVGRELVRDALEGRLRTVVVVRDEAHDRDHQIRRIELAAIAERLLERARGRVDTLTLDEHADLVASRPPGVEVAISAVELGEPDHPVERDPRHHFRVDEVARLAADLPDALVGVLPALDHGPADARQEVPEHVVDLAAVPAIEPGCVEQLAEDVELELGIGPVADPHRPRAAVALEPVELHLGEQTLAANTVHDLQLARAAGRRSPQPGHVGLRLLVVAEREQRVQRQRRIAKPAEAVVPVPLAADLFGKRRRCGRDDRACRCVRQRL